MYIVALLITVEKKKQTATFVRRVDKKLWNYTIESYGMAKD